MFQNVLGSDGRMHLERQIGNQRIDLTTGEVKTVIPGCGGMNTVIDESGVHAEMQIWNLMPSDFQSKVKSVRKLTNNVGGGSANKDAAVTATSDKLFLLSYSEIVPTSYWASSYPWTSNEGTQYEAFKGKVTNNYNSNSAIAIGSFWWERSVNQNTSAAFLVVNSSGDPSSNGNATSSYCVCPAFSF